MPVVGREHHAAGVGVDRDCTRNGTGAEIVDADRVAGAKTQLTQIGTRRRPPSQQQRAHARMLGPRSSAPYPSGGLREYEANGMQHASGSPDRGPGELGRAGLRHMTHVQLVDAAQRWQATAPYLITIPLVLPAERAIAARSR